jgi:hypothetical protein
MPSSRLRPIARLLTAGLLLSLPCPAYDTELSDTAVRNAYFLGQRHSKDTRDFLDPYSRHLPLPKSGPYISELRLLTPLAQIVELSDQQSMGYSAQQAWLEYRHRGDSLLLEIHIEFTPTYSAYNADRSPEAAPSDKGIKLRTEDFWQDFRFGIRQKDDWIEPRSIHGEPEYARSDTYGGGGLIGAWVWVEYEARNVPSDGTEVHVFTPDGQDVTTTFDLDKLK